MKRRVLSLLLTVTMVLTTITGVLRGISVSKTAHAEEVKYRNVGYYASWAGYARYYPITKVDASKLTHLNFAFANLKNDGSVVVGDEWIDTQITSGVYADMGFNWEDAVVGMAGHFGALKKIKARYPHLKTIISIGGWTWSNNFSDVAADPVKRAKMARTSVDFIIKYGFDGVDLDWEYPVEGGNSIPHRAEDKHNYTLLVKEIREALNEQSKMDGKTYYLTIAAGGNPTFVQNTEPVELMKYLDWINLMTYDYHGGFDPQTNHNTPLYLNPNDTTGSTFSIDQTVNAFLASGVEAKDLNLGLGFYGRGWVNVNATSANCLFHNGFAASATSAGLDIGTWEGSSWDYWDIKENYIGKRGYVRYWDDYAKVPYLYSPETKVFITYDDPESINIKIDYLMSKGLGGTMFWEASSDKNGDLLSITASRLGINEQEVIPPIDPETPVDPETPEKVGIYDNSKIYIAGDKVVYQGVIYQAKWWTQGVAPDPNNEWGVWKVIEGTPETKTSVSQVNLFDLPTNTVLATLRNVVYSRG